MDNLTPHDERVSNLLSEIPENNQDAFLYIKGGLKEDVTEEGRECLPVYVKAQGTPETLTAILVHAMMAEKNLACAILMAAQYYMAEQEESGGN